MHKLTVCATTSIVRYVSKIGLLKCLNNFKIHYSIRSAVVRIHTYALHLIQSEQITAIIRLIVRLSSAAWTPFTDIFRWHFAHKH